MNNSGFFKNICLGLKMVYLQKAFRVRSLYLSSKFKLTDWSI